VQPLIFRISARQLRCLGLYVLAFSGAAAALAVAALVSLANCAGRIALSLAV
jgi:hypothetical protein